MTSRVLRLSALLCTAAVISSVASAQPLSGTYNIGGASPDYNTISDAVADLISEGINAPVTFAIAPGTYNEQVEITSFTRYGSPTDEVLFRPSGPNVVVIWTASASNSADNYVLRLTGIEQFRIRNIEFEYHASAGIYRRLIDLGDNVDDLTIELCDFRGTYLASATTGTLIYRSGDHINNLIIQENVFTQGFVAVDLDNSTRTVSAPIIQDNTFGGQVDGGLKLDTTDDGIIDGNTFNDASWSDIYYEAITSDAYGITITNNYIDQQKGQTGIWLWALSNTTGLASSKLVANNVVAVKSSSASRGIYVAANNVQLYHNTIRTNGVNAEAIEVADRSEISLRNNLLVNGSTGPALVVDNDVSIVDADYNNYYTSGATLVNWDGTSYATLEDLQMGEAGNFDDHSTSTPVTFVATSGVSDLHLTGSSLSEIDLLATPIAGIVEDLDGTIRGTFTTFMGAYEGNTIAPLDNNDTDGFYTVDGSSPDFATVAEAVRNLNRRGVKGTVTFRIRAGTYPVHETIEFRHQNPSTGIDSVVFRAANPSSRPLLQHAATEADDNWLFKVVESDSVHFKNLNLEATGIGVYGRLIAIDGDVDHLSLQGCNLTGITGETGTESALVWSYSGGLDNLHFRDNTFQNGSFGLSLLHRLAAASPDGEDPVIRGNSFLDQEAGAIAIQHDYIVIEDNVIDGDATGYTGIYIPYTTGAEIRRNRIDARGTDAKGIQLYSVDGRSFAKPGLIVNNMITSAIGISIESTSSLWYAYHNTIRSGTYGDVPILV